MTNYRPPKTRVTSEQLDQVIAQLQALTTAPDGPEGPTAEQAAHRAQRLPAALSNLREGLLEEMFELVPTLEQSDLSTVDGKLERRPMMLRDKTREGRPS